MSTFLTLYVLFVGIIPLTWLILDYLNDQSYLLDWISEVSTGQFILLAIIFLPAATVLASLRILRLCTVDFWSFLGKIGPKEQK